MKHVGKQNTIYIVLYLHTYSTDKWLKLTMVRLGDVQARSRMIQIPHTDNTETEQSFKFIPISMTKQIVPASRHKDWVC